MKAVSGVWGRVALVASVLVMLGGPDLARAAPGDLDSTFGRGGLVSTDFGDGTFAAGIAVQADGKIVAAGGQWAQHDFALARYNPDGSLEGRVTTDFGGWDWATALALQPDGKIVVAGTAWFDPEKSRADFALARYNPDLSLEGTVTTNFGTPAIPTALALQPDGKIVVAGRVVFFLNFGPFPFEPRLHPTAPVPGVAGPAAPLGVIMARYNPDGSLDPTFGSGGAVRLPSETATALALQPDGRILVLTDSALARCNPNGSLDLTFGSGGLTGSGGSALALQPDGRIVVGGSDGDFTLVRYHPDGSLDRKVTTDFGGADRVAALALQPDGKIVAAGTTHAESLPPRPEFALARYSAEGSLDPGFGSGGKVVTGLGVGGGLDFGIGALANAVALQPDGKIVIGGEFLIPGGHYPALALARYQGDPIPLLSIATNQAAYRAGDRMIVTVTTDSGESSDRWHLVVALATPINTPTNPVFIFRFNPVFEFIIFQEARSRSFAQIAARPLSVVVAESVVILDEILPADLPVGAYEWLTAFFSEDLGRMTLVAVAPFTFQ